MSTVQTPVAANAYEADTPVERVRAADSTALQERYSLAIGYLRGFITLLVVAHHAVLAYHQFAPPGAPPSLTAEPRWWLVFPIVDSQRWPGFSLLVSFNDIFFMSLMFLLSGLFVWPSLRRKGTRAFLADRRLRLGVPFIVAAGLLSPLAYYPSYLAGAQTPTFVEFCRQWLSLGFWPGGPAWFLWVLLAFDVAAAAAFMIARAGGSAAGGGLSWTRHRSTLAFVLLVGASGVVYVPMLLIFGPFEWTTLGPFAVQTSRVLHYALYFAVGVAIGASTVDRGLLSPDGGLARHWIAWSATALIAFVLAVGIMTIAFARPDAPNLWGSIAGVAFALSCAATSFGLLAVFLRFVRSGHPALNSLRFNAYGIYLVHYAVVTWLQYSMLNAALSGLAKGSLVILGSVTVSWMLVAIARRLRAVACIV